MNDLDGIQVLFLKALGATKTLYRYIIQTITRIFAQILIKGNWTAWRNTSEIVFMELGYLQIGREVQCRWYGSRKLIRINIKYP